MTTSNLKWVKKGYDTSVLFWGAHPVCIVSRHAEGVWQAELLLPTEAPTTPVYKAFAYDTGHRSNTPNKDRARAWARRQLVAWIRGTFKDTP